MFSESPTAPKAAWQEPPRGTPARIDPSCQDDLDLALESFQDDDCNNNQSSAGGESSGLFGVVPVPPEPNQPRQQSNTCCSSCAARQAQSKLPSVSLVISEKLYAGKLDCIACMHYPVRSKGHDHTICNPVRPQSVSLSGLKGRC